MSTYQLLKNIEQSKNILLRFFVDRPSDIFYL